MKVYQASGTLIHSIFLQTIHLPWVYLTLLCSKPSKRVLSGKEDIRGLLKEVLEGTDLRRHKLTLLRNSKWDKLLSVNFVWMRQPATTLIFNAFRNKGQYHFLPKILGLYEPRSLSIRSTPPIPSLYCLIRWGCLTKHCEAPFTLRRVSAIGNWVWLLLVIVTTELSFHLQI